MDRKSQHRTIECKCSFTVEETIKFKDASSEDVKKLLDDLHKKHNHKGSFTGAVGLITMSSSNH